MRRLVIAVSIFLLLTDPVLADLRDRITSMVWWLFDSTQYRFQGDNTLIIKDRLSKKLEWHTREGAWEFGDDICWVGKNYGNFITYDGFKHCCYRASIVGEFLALTKVGGLGTQSLFCSSLTLRGKKP